MSGAEGTGAPGRRWFLRAPLGRSPSLEGVVGAVAGEPLPFVLHGRWGLPAGAQQTERVLIAGVAPAAVFTDEVDPFARLDAMPELAEPAPPGVVGGGLVGWFGFGLGRVVEPTVGPGPPRPAALATSHLAWYDDVIRRDECGEWWVEALAPDPDPTSRKARLAQAVDRWQARLDAAAAVPSAELGPMRIARGAAAHREAVRETIRRIHAGELFQANICLRLAGELDGPAAGLAAGILTATDAWYGGWIQGPGEQTLLSASPERFLRRRGRAVSTAPIKGTAPRDEAATDPGVDPAAQALLASSKDAAEHVMIVDLMRNDLGRVCDYGSVHPEAAPQLEAHAGVWHLVTRVDGTLHEGLGDARLVRACFPPGSVTGAPKVQALQAIASVEGTGRELYTGAHGFASPAAGLELAVTIRSLECAGRAAWLGVGGGIVSDSQPEAELQEALTKARAILAAARSGVDATETPSSGTAVPRDKPNTDASDLAGGERLLAMTSRDRRPDPAAGLLETLLVTGGRAEHLDRHLERLSASSRVLGQALPPAALRAEIATLAATARGRSRIRVLQTSGGSHHALQLLDQPDAGLRVVSLRPAVVPGGIGSYKWLDRELIDAVTKRLGASPLLLDGDGTILESGWANVWWLDVDGVLCTPPLDGRQLPGITRAVLLERAASAGVAVAERPRIWDASLGLLPLLLTSASGVAVATVPESSAAAVDAAGALAGRIAPLLVDRDTAASSA